MKEQKLCKRKVLLQNMGAGVKTAKLIVIQLVKKSPVAMEVEDLSRANKIQQWNISWGS
jgi:hypothetical protein